MSHEAIVQVPPVVEVDDEDRRQLLASYVQAQERILELQREVTEALRVKESVEREFADFKERITVRMHAEADRRDWCSEFDDIMQEFGLRRRTRQWDIVFEGRVTVNMSLIARDEDHARRLAWNALRVSNETYQINGQDVHIGELECEYCEAE